MKYLGIDHGKKRVGIAVSDPEGKIAFPRKTIASTNAPEEIEALVKTEDIQKIILGLPVSMEGRETPQTALVREFAQELHLKLTVPIEFQNELLSTHLAESEGIKKEHADEAAAALILQSYLDKLNYNKQ